MKEEREELAYRERLVANKTLELESLAEKFQREYDEYKVIRTEFQREVVEIMRRLGQVAQPPTRPE